MECWGRWCGGLDSSLVPVAVDDTVGLELNFNPRVPLDIVIEYTRHLWVVHDVDLDLIAFAGHIRVYF